MNIYMNYLTVVGTSYSIWIIKLNVLLKWHVLNTTPLSKHTVLNSVEWYSNSGTNVGKSLANGSGWHFTAAFESHIFFSSFETYFYHFIDLILEKCFDSRFFWWNTLILSHCDNSNHSIRTKGSNELSASSWIRRFHHTTKSAEL